MGTQLEPVERTGRAQDLAAMRAELGEAAFAAAWAEGRAMPLKQAVAYALENPTPALIPQSATQARAQ